MSIATENDTTITRRRLFMKLGIMFNGLVAVVLAVPLVRFLLSAVARENQDEYLSWVTLGPVGQFPEGETRLATFRSPYVTPTDGKTVDTACWVRRIADGERAAGPPERGLFTYPHKVENGVLSIQAGELPTPGGPIATNYKNRERKGSCV